MDGIPFKMAKGCYWYVQPDGELMPWLIAHSAGFDVEVLDQKGRVLQVQGPNSMPIMADLTKGVIDDAMKLFHYG
jgi:glycine cleavage system aminomethyltransferase T